MWGLCARTPNGLSAMASCLERRDKDGKRRGQRTRASDANGAGVSDSSPNRTRSLHPSFHMQLSSIRFLPPRSLLSPVPAPAAQYPPMGRPDALAYSRTHSAPHRTTPHDLSPANRKSVAGWAQFSSAGSAHGGLPPGLNQEWLRSSAG
ncbi:hypothetical protein CC86DRAFT_384819 [Ophiobolus disseminans]|uniref:Uncharacterized protein n=1 Tax=Ophiobolus disseminans TaxID=1469910 RepID=A0A6A6ZRQ8_9PLEO|nr:hypothetical protein CC86DRAFT_384819 [Ophiobolus disseminans]